MSEASIEYKDEGDICGISVVQNSQLSLHEVCSDGLACVRTTVDGGEATIKRCQSVDMSDGERCIPQYNNCYGALECKLNVDGWYSCGGSLPWSGNEEYVKTRQVKASSFEMKIPFIVAGSAVLFIYFVVLVYELFVKDHKKEDKSIYSNRFGKPNNNSDGSRIWKLFR